MNRREPSPKKEFRPKPPKWNSPIWYLPLMLLLLWFWQTTIIQFTYRTIPYSEFKEHLRRGEVIECSVKEDAIEGKIHLAAAPATAATPTNAPAAQPITASKKDFLFRTS